MVNNVLLLPTLARRTTQQVKDDDDLYKGQRSTEVKCGKLRSMAAIYIVRLCSDLFTDLVSSSSSSSVNTSLTYISDMT